ncbi:MAG: phosphatase PAP2 family protein [Vallitaleaceae bacterium]|nr:phosphatase PAP2 family protein [Vallitaleaceae bacterium]
MELDIIRSIQEIMSPTLDQIMIWVTMFAEEAMIIGLLTFIFWNIDKVAAKRIGFVLITSMTLNNIIKDLFNYDRPIGEEGIISLRTETATGQAFPSGHTQVATTFYVSMGLWFKKNWLVTLGIVIGLIVGFSRVYLGLHYPKDVVVGFVLALIISLVFYNVLRNLRDDEGIMIGAMIVLGIGFFFSHSEDFIKAYGLLIGFVAGIIFESRMVDFKMKARFYQKIIRWILGLAIMIGLKVGLKMIFPETDLFNVIRYILFAFIGIGVYPIMFNQLKILGKHKGL